MGKFSLKSNKAILIVFLVAIAVFSLYRYVRAVQEKNNLLAQLNQAKEQLTILENQRQNLLTTIEKEKQQNILLRRNLKAGIQKIEKTNMALSEIKAVLQEVNAQISALKLENQALIEAKSTVEKERDALQARLGSEAELKKAMNELKRQAFNVGIQVIKKTQERVDQEEMGNQGFVIKDGKPTYPPEVKIEVSPAPKEK